MNQVRDLSPSGDLRHHGDSIGFRQANVQME